MKVSLSWSSNIILNPYIHNCLRATNRFMVNIVARGALMSITQETTYKIGI
jgi:hypothetical protein